MPKKARLDSLPAALDVAALPRAATDLILQFFAPLGDLEPHALAREAPMATAFLALASVSKAWFALADAAASERALRRLVLYGASGTRSAMLALRDELTLRGSFVREIRMDKVPDFGDVGGDFWDSAMRSVPGLRRLEFTGVRHGGPSSDVLIPVVEAVARHCPLLEKLAFPKFIPPPRRFSGVAHHLDKLLEIVLSMKNLRQLTLNMEEVVYSSSTSNNYIGKIIRFCPQIEVLDGYKLNTWYGYDDKVECGELWQVDLATWRHFCETCTQLTEFDWVCVPFATQYFEIFGATPKPNLTKLNMTTPHTWEWKRFLTQVPHDRAAIKKAGYAVTAKRPEAVLRACPALRELTICWHVDSRDENEYMEPKVFGDSFFAGIAEKCPNLVSLKIHAVPDYELGIYILTGRTLSELAKLAHLEKVYIDSPNQMDDGLFDLVVCHAAATRSPREYFIKSGSMAGGGYHSGFKTFLQRLVEYPGELPCLSRSVWLHVQGCRRASAPSDPMAFLLELRDLAAQVKTKYPTVGLRALVQNRVQSTEQVVTEFQFWTGNPQVRDWIDYPFKRPNGDRYDDIDTPIDETFTHRDHVHRSLAPPQGNVQTFGNFTIITLPGRE